VAWKDLAHGHLEAAGAGRRRVRRLNVEGDGQGDLGGHGGEQRAVFVYQIESYRYWESGWPRDFSTAIRRELSIEGLPDDEVCIGDRYRIGSALFEVTAANDVLPRRIRLDEPQMAALLTPAGGRASICASEEGEVGAVTILPLLEDPSA